MSLHPLPRLSPELQEMRTLAKWITEQINTKLVEQVIQELAGQLTDEQLGDLLYSWPVWARGPDIKDHYSPQCEQLLSHSNWTHWLVLAGRGFGKALSLDTLVPTPYGWTTMGGLKAGDIVFDECGKQCTVTKAFDVMHNRPCVELLFNDDTTIIADEDHEWLTAVEKQDPSVVTTRHISLTLDHKHRVESRRPGEDRTTHRYIVDAWRVPSVPVRCIQVDSPSHLFLVTDSFIPTHNSRTGSEWVRYQIESGNMRHIALIGRTPRDAADVMVLGRSGLLNTCPPWNRPLYEPSKLRLTWPDGATATIYSAEKPDKLRGPEHDGYWADELAAYRFLDEVWDNLLMGLRVRPKDGRARGVITTTPRALPLLRDLVQTATLKKNRGEVYMVQASTLENAQNLPPARLKSLVKKYQGSRLGLQELEAKILDDSPGALWKRDDIKLVYQAPETLPRVVIGVDPQKAAHGAGGSLHKKSTKTNCMTGIIAAARMGQGKGLVLGDHTLDGKSDEWAKVVVDCYHTYKADAVVAESNAGGDMVRGVIHAIDPNINVVLVHASRGKATRAEPVAMFYKRGQVFHLGSFAELEDQMCTWDPDDSESPDRVDALVWAFTDLLLGNAAHDDGDRSLYGYGRSRDWDRDESTSSRRFH